MRLIKLIARQTIISPSGEIIEDEGLKALDAYREELVTVSDETEIEKIESDFRAKYNLGDLWSVEVEIIDE